MDRRIIKTRKEIRQALIELMKEKDFEAITVSHIADRANINRGTFYLHYIDKYDMLDKYEIELFMKLKDIALVYVTDDITMEEFINTRHSTMVNIFKCLKEERELLAIILQTRGFFSLQERMITIFTKFLRSSLPAFIKDYKSKYPLDFLAVFASGNFISTIQYWLQTDMEYSPEELAQIVWDIFSKGPLGALGIDLPKNS
ncbi:TetR/AcrR family transcriptional regulator [Kurthia sibirica]|uniref:HTH tetR-type domain-containing protein n=1 Tax=Kurthia sibirica TaxID=202750 RepID=A0A2U3AMW7_9BACL|nr:TetR/AcrR family transcriptional regulator [Kurthia sibirica]PWI25867.1 hypothetical protein DEX24_06605 [Kurthia sibirica]GEK34307.1 TetR family transcriptional regulator [Kurthia sibirica]